MGKNAKLKEKQKWSNEKLHINKARKLRGIYFIDPEDKEFKETVKNARKKLETPVAPAVPHEIIKNNKNCGMVHPIKSKQDLHHSAGEGNNAMQHYNLVHKFMRMPQAIKIPAAKAALDNEWEKLEKNSAWNLTNVRNKSEVIDEARTSGAKVHFASLMDMCHMKMLNWRQSTKNTKVELYS